MKRVLAGAVVLALAVVATNTVATPVQGQVEPTSRDPTAPKLVAGGGGDLGGGGGPECISHVPVKGSKALHRDGSEGPAQPNDGQGRAWYVGGPNDDVRGYSPPMGFKAITATDDELAAYHLLPRPTDPVALAEWHKMYANYSAPDPTTPPETCVRNRSNWFVGKHDIWAGAVNNGAPPEGYWQVQLGFRQTAFD